MNILVTGGAGFIGSNLIKELVKNHEVTVIDNYHTGNILNIKNIIKNYKICLCEISSKCINNVDDIKEIDIIIHLGIASSSPMYKENPYLVSDTLNNMINILECAKENNIKKIIYASSSSLYNNMNLPYNELMIPKVTDYYTEARYYVERIAKLYYELYDINSVGLRFFSVYGPNEKFKEKYANIITQFIWDMKKDVSPIIYGDGEQTRDFTYVNDIIQAITLFTNSEFKYDIYNVGTGVSYSFNQIIDILNDLMNKNIKPVYVKNPIKNYVKDTLADISKIQKVGYDPQYSIEEGITKLIQSEI